MDSAEQLLIDRGYAHVSVSDICASAGFTRGAFYSNFATKDDLALALFDKHAQHNLARLQSLLGDVPARPRRDWVQKFFVVEQQDRGWILLFLEFRLYAARQPDLAAKLDHHDHAIAGELADILNRSLELDGGLSRQQAKAILAAREGILARSVRADHAADDVVHAAAIATTKLLAALVPAGRPRNS